MPRGTPRFVSVFDPYRCLISLCGRNDRSSQISLALYTCFYLFYYYFSLKKFLTLKQENVVIAVCPFREEIKWLCFLHVQILPLGICPFSSLLCLIMPCTVFFLILWFFWEVRGGGYSTWGGLNNTNWRCRVYRMNCSWLLYLTQRWCCERDPHEKKGKLKILDTLWLSNCAGTHPRYSFLYPHPFLNALACLRKKKN